MYSHTLNQLKVKYCVTFILFVQCFSLGLIYCFGSRARKCSATIQISQLEDHWGSYSNHFPGAGARPMRVMLGANRASLQWNVSQPRWRSEGLARTSVWSLGWMWRESGTTSKTKSKSVSVLHGCQGLEGCPFSKTATVPIPQRQGSWDGSMPPLLFDLVSPERMSFLLSAPQCTGKQGPGRAPAVMLI